ncbi:hypothetical protein CC78DRAFT_573393 [Lojkania enalia]|uniref:Uncharacterized protein n=1 Tax=Lojkania enalia TaxID=147567 RepID=A0A9P4NDB1_9PLEO|nr:hypothetical protein CC78DRAFT_573393 [Didymosphaeria enalia]
MTYSYQMIAATPIILGKTTLSEIVGTGVRCGWPALCGQPPTSYVKEGIDMAD